MGPTSPSVCEPIFLVGAERSGSTLLRLILDSHPEIAFGEEFEYAVDLVGENGEFPDMDDYRRYLEVNRMFSTSGFEYEEGLTYLQLVDGFLRQRQRRKGVDHVGATIHFGFSKALTIWPNAKLIHIVRDPRDVSPSNVEMGWAGNVWFGLDKWIEAEQEWDAVQSNLAPRQFLNVNFSDLIDDHEATLRTICEFVGVGYTEAMFSYEQDTDYQRPMPGVASGWESKLSDQQVRLIEARAGSLLADRGFEPSGLPPLALTDRSIHILKLQHQVGKLKRRSEFYGSRLVVSGLLARVTKNEDWRRSVQIDINEIEKGRLKKSWSDNSVHRSSR